MYLPSFDAEKMKKLLNENLFDYNIRKHFSCIISRILAQDKFIGNLRVRKYITNFRNGIVGGIWAFEGTGINFEADINGTSGLLQIILINKTRNDHLPGVNITNELKKRIPNFLFVYFLGDTSIPKMDYDRANIISWPSEKENVFLNANLIVMEKVTGESFKDFSTRSPRMNFFRFSFNYIWLPKSGKRLVMLMGNWNLVN